MLIYLVELLITYSKAPIKNPEVSLNETNSAMNRQQFQDLNETQPQNRAISFFSPDSALHIRWDSPPDMPARNIYSVLKNELRCSNTVIQRLRFPNRIFVNGVSVRVADKIGPGCSLEVLMSEPDDSALVPENIPIVVLYEDDFFIAVDKPANIPVHPTTIYKSGTLANALAWHLTEKGVHRRIRPVTRLDKNTSGVTLFAKTAHAQHELSRQSAVGIFNKTYFGIAQGLWENNSGTIDLPIRRKSDSIIQRETHTDGDASITHFNVIRRLQLKSFNETNSFVCTLLSFKLETGRTHQIRVHCSSMGHPLLGDTLYGGLSHIALSGQALNCDEVSFLHPARGERVVIRSLCTSPMFQLIQNAL